MHIWVLDARFKIFFSLPTSGSLQIMSTHPAVIAKGIKQPLSIGSVLTPAIQPGEVRVRVEWVPSAPLDVYQIDAGLMAEFPQSFGDTAAGTVVAAADDVKRLKVGDKVFGFFFHNEKEKAQQIYVTAPEHLFAKVCWTPVLHLVTPFRDLDI